MGDLDIVVNANYLADVVNRLEGVDKEIIVNYYGLNGLPVLSLKENFESSTEQRPPQRGLLCYII